MMKKFFAMLLIFLFLNSLIPIGALSQEEQVDWNNKKSVEEALKQRPEEILYQYPQQAIAFIRNNPKILLDNPNVAIAYFNKIDVIIDPKDIELAEKYLSRNIVKINNEQISFDLRKGRLQIKNGFLIIDERGKTFSIESIRLMADVIKVESLDGGGLRFHFRKKYVVDIIEANSFQQGKEDLIIDNKQIMLPEERQGLRISSDANKLSVNCQTDYCNFATNGLNINLKRDGTYQEIENLIKTEKAIVVSGQDKLFGNLEFYLNGQGIDKTKPISIIGEKSFAYLDGNWHRTTPKNLNTGAELAKSLSEAISKNREFVDGIVDSKSQSVMKICLQCNPSLRNGFEEELSSGKINGYVFALTNAISNKQVMINKGEVISNYGNSIIIGAHKTSEFTSTINPNNIIVDGPHSKEKDAYLGSVIANGRKLDHFNVDGKSATKEDVMYKFGNIVSTRFFFPEAVNENVRRLISFGDFIKASNTNPTSSSGIVAVNRLLGGARNTASIQNQGLRKAYEDLAQLLDKDRNPKQVVNLNDAYVQNQKVNNLYIFKNNGELKLSQSGENHELFKVIAKEQAADSFLSYIQNSPTATLNREILSQMQRIAEFMAWKNTALHAAAARYEEFTNVWGFVPLKDRNLWLWGQDKLTSAPQAFLQKIDENEKAQQGSQEILRLMSEGLTLSQIRDKNQPTSDVLRQRAVEAYIDSVFNDPGIDATLQLERASKQIKEQNQLRSETVRILNDAVQKYQTVNEPEQAMILQADLIRAKYGYVGESITSKIVSDKGYICETSTGCGGIFQNIDQRLSEKLGSANNRFVLKGTQVLYPEGWSNELAADVKKLFDLNLKVEQNENLNKFRSFTESFFEGQQLGLGLVFAVGTGGLLTINRAAGALIKEYPRLAVPIRAGQVIASTEESITGISSAILAPKAAAKLGISDTLREISPTQRIIAGGSDALTPSDVVKLFEQAGGSIDVYTAEQLVPALNRNPLTPEQVKSIAEISKVDYSGGDALLRSIAKGVITPEEIDTFTSVATMFSSANLLFNRLGSDISKQTVLEISKIEGIKSVSDWTVVPLALGFEKGNIDAQGIQAFIRDTKDTGLVIKNELADYVGQGKIDPKDIPIILKRVENVEGMDRYEIYAQFYKKVSGTGEILSGGQASTEIIEQFYKPAETRTHPIRFDKTYDSIEEEYRSLQDMYKVDPEHIVKPLRLDYDKDGKVIGFYVERIEGTPILDYIKNHGPIPIEIEAEIRATIQKLHNDGLAHGDLPGNILITDDGRNFKIIDPVGYERNFEFQEKAVYFDIDALDKIFGRSGGLNNMPTNPPVALRKDIYKVKNFDEFYGYIHLTGTIIDEHGSTYTPRELVELIKKFRRGELDITELPRAGGIRSKIVDLSSDKSFSSYATPIEYGDANKPVTFFEGQKIDPNTPTLIDLERFMKGPKLAIDFENDQILRGAYYEDVLPKVNEIIGKYSKEEFDNPEFVLRMQLEILDFVHDFVMRNVPYSWEYDQELFRKYGGGEVKSIVRGQSGYIPIGSSELSEARNLLIGESCLFVAGVCKHSAALEAAFAAKLADDGKLSGWATINTGPKHGWAEFMIRKPDGSYSRYIMDARGGNNGLLEKLELDGKGGYVGQVEYSRMFFKYGNSQPWVVGPDAHLDYYFTGSAYRSWSSESIQLIAEQVGANFNAKELNMLARALETVPLPLEGIKAIADLSKTDYSGASELIRSLANNRIAGQDISKYVGVAKKFSSADGLFNQLASQELSPESIFLLAEAQGIKEIRPANLFYLAKGLEEKTIDLKAVETFVLNTKDADRFVQYELAQYVGNGKINPHDIPEILPLVTDIHIEADRGRIYEKFFRK